MRTENPIIPRLILAVFLATTAAACDPVDESPQPPGVPISAPISSDFRHSPDVPGCADPAVAEEWSYTWLGDRLQTAVMRMGDGTVADQQGFVYDDAGRLRTWTWGTPGAPIEVQLTRDDAGALTEWTHTDGGDALTVTIDREDAAVGLRIVGPMFLGFHTPLLIDLDRIDPDLPTLSPRLDLIFGHLERQAAMDDEAVWAVLEAIDATQRVEQTGEGVRTVVDVDGDGAPDVIELVSAQGEGEMTTVDFAIDGQVDVTIDARPGRTERFEIDPDGVATRTVTLVEPDHVFIDRLDEDGQVADRSSLFFDAQGARIMKYEDDNADGVPNWRKRYINHPETGLRIFDETDSGADGRIDRHRAYRHDAAGHVIRATLSLVERGDCGDTW